MKYSTTLLFVLSTIVVAPPVTASFDFGSSEAASSSTESTAKAAQEKAEKPIAFGDEKIAVADQVSLADVGLGNFKTFWIPGKYRTANSPLLYLNGQKFLTPDGYSNVPGFLPAPYGYMVAVRQPTSASLPVAAAESAVAMPKMMLTQEMLSRMTPEQQIAALNAQVQLMQAQGAASVQKPSAAQNQEHVVLYKVSPEGKVLGVVAEVATSGAHSTWVTSAGIFIAKGNIDARTFDVVGYSIDGKRIDGPLGTTYASPAPNGDWYFLRPIARSGIRVEDTLRLTKDGDVSTVREEGTSSAHFVFRKLVPTEQAFADMPPLADTFRTGYSMGTHYHNGRGGIQGEPEAMLLAVSLDRKNEVTLGKSGSIGEVNQVASRGAWMGTPERPVYLGQATTAQLRDPGTNYYMLNAKDIKDNAPVTTLRSRGSNFLRNMLNSANVNSDFTFWSNMEMYVITTPATTVGIRGKTVNGNAVGVDFGNKKILNSMQTKEFANRYGFVLGR